MLKFSNKPLLVASGCSHTDHNYKSSNHPEIDTSWPKWPQIFAEEHGYEYINVGRSGAGNDYISNSIIDTVTDYPETKLVLILWSGWERLNFYGRFFNPHSMNTESIEHRLNRYKDNPEQVAILKHWYYKKVKLQKWEEMSEKAREIVTVENLVDRNLRIMYQTLEFLEHKNIKYIFVSADYGMNWLIGRRSFISDPQRKINHHNLKKLLDYMLDHRYFDLLDTQNFWGFPMFKELGGKSAYKLPEFWTPSGPNLEYIISKYDTHPNAKGQEKFAEIFSETYKKVYC